MTEENNGFNNSVPQQPATPVEATQPQHAAPQPQAPAAAQPQHAAYTGTTQQIPVDAQQAYTQQAAYQQRVYEEYAKRAAQQHVKTPKPPVDPEKKTLGKTFAAGFAGAALAVLIGVGGFAGYQAVTGNGGTTTTLGATTSTEITADDTDETLAEAVAAKALPSIVSIDIYESSSSSSMSAFGFEVPGTDDDSSLTQTSLGSGVVISSDGYIITNNHVVEGADAIKATINGVEYDATLVGSDSSSDIAVIKVDATDLTAIEIGSSDDLEVGEWVMSLGSPFGLENSVSSGIVSALQRSTTMTDSTTGETVIYPNMIQTDATINPGNSGGALVDSDGKLIGINSMIQSSSGSSSGVGFAIPVDYAMELAQQIIEGKTPTHAQLGVSMAQIDEQTAMFYGLATDTGVYVANVYEGSGAAEAGIESGDIITAIEGEAVESPSDLQIAVRSHNPGDSVEITVNRDGEEMTFTVTLGSDENTSTSSSSNSGSSNQYGYNNNGSNGYGNNGSGSGNGYNYFGF